MAGFPCVPFGGENWGLGHLKVCCLALIKVLSMQGLRFPPQHSLSLPGNVADNMTALQRDSR